MPKFQNLRTAVVQVFWVLFLAVTAYAQPYQDAMFLNQEQQPGAAESPENRIWITVVSIAALLLVLYLYKIRKTDRSV